MVHVAPVSYFTDLIILVLKICLAFTISIKITQDFKSFEVLVTFLQTNNYQMTKKCLFKAMSVKVKDVSSLIYTTKFIVSFLVLTS